MRFLTDDGSFGFLVTPLPGHDMFRFQLVIGSHLIGDSEPCILGSAMYRLGHLDRLDDERLSQVLQDPGGVMSTLESDEFHDAAVLSLAESLDGWAVDGYVHHDSVVMLARQYHRQVATGPILVSVVVRTEYDPIVDAMHSYWAKASNSRHSSRHLPPPCPVGGTRHP